jgi:hypothetical protein
MHNRSRSIHFRAPPLRSTPSNDSRYPKDASDVNPFGRGRSRRYLMCMPEIARAITSCWISAVPSKMS